MKVKTGTKVEYTPEGVVVTRKHVHRHGTYGALYTYKCPCGKCRGREHKRWARPGLREAAARVALGELTAKDVALKFKVSRSRVHQLAKEAREAA